MAPLTMVHPIVRPWRKPAFAGCAAVAQWAGANARSHHVIATPPARREPAVRFDESAWASAVRHVPAQPEPAAACLPHVGEDVSEGDGLDDADVAAADDEQDAETEADTAALASVEIDPRATTVALDDAALCALIERIGSHDDKALAALYDATSPRVFGLVGRIVADGALAEEVVEDTYWQVWRQAQRFDAGRGRPLTWLLAMARSRAIDALRRRERKAHITLEDDEQAALCDERNAGPPDLLAATRSEHLLHQALAALDAQPRQLIALAFFRGLTHEEIAGCTGLPLGTVKSQIRRSLQALKQRLAEAGCAALPW